LEKLLDQQQQLTMISNRKIEQLKLQYEDNIETEKKEVKQKRKWYHSLFSKKQ